VAEWVRNLVMVVVVVVWAAVVVTSLVRGVLPDAITWGVPGAVYFALNPTISLTRRDSKPPAEGPH
jgi:hypothetical protein